MKPSTSEFLAAFLLITFGMLSLYVAFVFHDALYPKSGENLKAFLVIVVAYLGFAALHKAQHIGKRAKDLNSLEVMEVDE